MKVGLVQARSQYSTSGSKSPLLETTRLRYDNTVNEAADYLKQLIDEKKQLIKTINVSGDEHHGSEMFKRFEYLKNVDELAADMHRLENDISELEKMGENENEEMKKLIEADLESTRMALIKKKIALVELLIPEEREDKESAMLELSAGVGGLESRIFCSELFEMYQKYAEV